ncbi:cyclic-phosphate processing receiver domain-containing protein, partial [Aeromonas media]|uniref:cyclic-phosphate processing receiver domain-containing protein n=1 Tax=Aeromonas media TaxID=651 RepID=UPI001BD2383E
FGRPSTKPARRVGERVSDFGFDQQGRVFLDDERTTPAGWIRVYWPSEAIALLKTGAVEELSLDHDLGDDERGTGYDVVLWIEEAVALHQFNPPKITVHSANSSAREKMLAGIRSIEQLASLNGR